MTVLRLEASALRYLALAPLSLLASPVLAQPVLPIPADGMAMWSVEEQSRGVTYRSDAVSIAFRPQIEPETAEIIPVVTVTFRGMPPVTIRGKATHGLFTTGANVGRWKADGTPFVLFQNRWGGTQCCTERTLVYPDGGQARIVDLGSEWLGNPGDTPTDEDGDGTVDFVYPDESFTALMDWRSGHLPPRILNVIDGSVEDASNRPGFRRIFEEHARATRQACIGTEEGRNDACAGFVAAAARLGRLEEAWIEVRRHHEPVTLTQCRVPETETGCPAGQSFEVDYPRALYDHLAKHRYIPAPAR